MRGKVTLWGLSVYVTCGLFCSSVNIGTDILNVKDIVNSGKVQTAWGPNPTKTFPSTVSEFYLYVEGFSHFAPEFREVEFHHADEDADMLHSWVYMNVTEDDEDTGLLDKVTVYKVTQKCHEREGGHTVLLNVTFTATTCDPVTISWMKDCGQLSTAAQGLFVGFSKSSKEVAEDGIVTQMFDADIKEDVYKVPYDEEETTLFIYRHGANSPVFLGTPFVIADHEVLYPVLNGSAADGGWVSAFPMELNIAYNCLKEKGTKEEVLLVLELPYFRNLEVHLLKQCGVSKRKASKMSWLKVLFILGIGSVGVYSVLFLLLWFQKGEDSLSLLPCGQEIVSVLRDLKGRIAAQRYHPIDMNDRELPSVESSHKTQYGTV